MTFIKMDQELDHAQLNRIRTGLKELEQSFPEHTKRFQQCYEKIKEDLYSGIEVINTSANEKKEKIRQGLLDSLVEPSNADLASDEDFEKRQFQSIEDIVNFLSRLKIVLDQTQRRIVYLSGRFGVVLALAKKLLDKKHFSILLRDFNYTKRYADFLIWMSDMCTTFPKLKRSSAPIRLFFGNQRIIEEILVRDGLFWSED